MESSSTEAPAIDPFRKQRIFWFVGMNLIAMAIAATLFYGFLYGAPLDVLVTKLLAGIFEYKLVVVLLSLIHI